MIRPLLATCFPASCSVKNAPLAFMADRRSKSSSVMSTVGVSISSTPALATTMSSWPKMGDCVLEQPFEFVDATHVGLDGNGLAGRSLDGVDGLGCRSLGG